MKQMMNTTLSKENKQDNADAQQIWELTGRLKAIESINDKFQKE